MKRNLLLLCGSLALLATGAHAQSLFTTSGDFNGWSSGSGTNMIVATTTTNDLDGVSASGLGNTGTSGAGGSLSLGWQVGAFNYIFSPGEQGNAAFISALQHASIISLQTTTPPAGTGNYFTLGLVLNYQGGFDQLGSATSSTVGGVTTETFDFTGETGTLVAKEAANGGGFSYFQFGVIYNSNFTPPAGNPFFVDSIQAIPEPTSMALLGLGALGLGAMFARRRLQ